MRANQTAKVTSDFKMDVKIRKIIKQSLNIFQINSIGFENKPVLQNSAARFISYLLLVIRNYFIEPIVYIM